MATLNIPVIIHGVTGRMGQIALGAVQQIASEGTLQVNGEQIKPVPIGVARNIEKLKLIAYERDLTDYFVDLPAALEKAHQINSKYVIYHNTIATGIRKSVILPALTMLNPTTTAVFMEKPLAANYGDGLAIVQELEKRKFYHGIVHHMLETPGIKSALGLIEQIRPLSCQMLFGYEVAPGLSDKFDYCCQRPDFNWQLAAAGGGIILDMCHESYISNALFGETERLSAVARLLVPRRISTDRTRIIECDVEDYAHLRREHTNGVVNTSIWSWYRRINSEFGPLEITIEGERGSIVFGLYGLKIQWKETAPILLWERGEANLRIKWRDSWQYLELSSRNPFAIELAEFIESFLTGQKYPRNAITALNILGEVEAFYESAARNGDPIERKQFLNYPQSVPHDWQPERLQNKLRSIKSM